MFNLWYCCFFFCKNLNFVSLLNVFSASCRDLLGT